MPKTLKEARLHFYGIEYGLTKKKSNFVEGRCIEEVTKYSGRWPSHHQCSRKACIDGIWCKQHNPASIEQKRDTEFKVYDTVEETLDILNAQGGVK